MTFSENGSSANEKVEENLSTLETELSGINYERFKLSSDVENQWPNIPPEAVNYLSNKCSKPEFMTMVLEQMEQLSDSDPTIWSMSGLWKSLIDDFIVGAESSYVGIQQGKTDSETIELVSTKQVLNAIASETTNLKGRAKLEVAREYLNDPEISQTIREELAARFDQIEATLASMSAVFTDPASRSEFDRIVSNASFDLGAPNLSLTFAPILEQMEASDTFTIEQKYKLREIVTGSDAQHSLAETITDENGNTIPRFTETNKREFRKGVSGYVEGHGHQIIEARAGDRMITKDVTGWSDEDVGFLIEMTHMWNMYDSFGVTGFIEDVYKIDFSILGDGNAFDPIQIIHLRQVLSHLTGSFEGYDGEIANLSEHKTLIQNQSRYLAVIQSFGSYTKEHYGNGAPDQLRLVEYLNRLHPELVKPLSGEEAAIGILAKYSEV